MMKNFVLALALFSNSGNYEGLIVVPGVYTQRECGTVKALMDRDHNLLIHTGKDATAPAGKLFARSNCVDTTKLPSPTTGGPDEMVK